VACSKGEESGKKEEKEGKKTYGLLREGTLEVTSSGGSGVEDRSEDVSLEGTNNDGSGGVTEKETDDDVPRGGEAGAESGSLNVGGGDGGVGGLGDATGRVACEKREKRVSNLFRHFDAMFLALPRLFCVFYSSSLLRRLLPLRSSLEPPSSTKNGEKSN
jgi:hypothetical protein